MKMSFIFLLLLIGCGRKGLYLTGNISNTEMVLKLAKKPSEKKELPSKATIMIKEICSSFSYKRNHLYPNYKDHLFNYQISTQTCKNRNTEVKLYSALLNEDLVVLDESTEWNYELETDTRGAFKTICGKIDNHETIYNIEENKDTLREYVVKQSGNALIVTIGEAKQLATGEYYFSAIKEYTIYYQNAEFPRGVLSKQRAVNICGNSDKIDRAQNEIKLDPLTLGK